jgi:RecA/RadA recombinase
MAQKSSAAIFKDYEDYLFDADELDAEYYFHTGIIALDTTLSEKGGIPGGSIIQLLGEPSHGKSTFAYDLIAQAQKRGMKDVVVQGKPYNAVVLDIERSFNRHYAEIIGIDWRKVKIVRTPFAEQSFSIAETFLRAGIQFVLVDSIGMLVAADEEDKDYDDSERVAVEAKALGRFTKRVNAFMGLDTLVVIINQYRANLKQMGHAPEKKAYGARVMQYANKLTIELRRTGSDGDRTHITAFIAKNKLGGRIGINTEFDIVSTEGIDYWQHVLKLAIEYGIVIKRAAYYYYPTFENFTHRVQGETKTDTFPQQEITDKVIAFIKENITDGESEDESTAESDD